MKKTIALLVVLIGCYVLLGVTVWNGQFFKLTEWIACHLSVELLLVFLSLGLVLGLMTKKYNTPNQL